MYICVLLCFVVVVIVVFVFVVFHFSFLFSHIIFPRVNRSVAAAAAAYHVCAHILCVCILFYYITVFGCIVIQFTVWLFILLVRRGTYCALTNSLPAVWWVYLQRCGSASIRRAEYCIIARTKQNKQIAQTPVNWISLKSGWGGQASEHVPSGSS